ncbi:MAG: peptidylprolyl isomerase [Eubacteriales bacterium]|nr:peptidylprolyl isomerase [Eubacteriales bacterium]
MKKFLGILTALLLIVGLSLAESPNTVLVSMKIKDMGTIKLELYPDKAPQTVANFVSLAKSGYYNGLIFHRVIKGFMIQGGDPTGTGMGGPGYSIKGEFGANGFKNPISHKRGVISMARTNIPDSAGSQFFICHQDSEFLDNNYAAFGMVTEEIEIVDSIAETPTNDNDKPINDIIIDSITIDNDVKLVDFEKLK